MSRLEKLIAFHEEDPSDSFVLFALASEYRKLGQLDTALACFEKLKESDASYVGLYYHLGKLKEELNEYSDAIQIYREGIVIATQVADLHARSELQSALLEVEMSEDL